MKNNLKTNVNIEIDVYKKMVSPKKHEEKLLKII